MQQRSKVSNKTRRPFTHQLLAGLLSACLVACGGTDDAADSPGVVVTTEPFSTLIADDGTSLPPAPDTIPADAAARTRANRYASAQQAEQLERALGDGVLLVNVACCGAEAVDLAIAIAYGMQAAGDLPNSTPVLVRAADLRLGAVAADRLADAGYANVWLVTR